MSCIVKENVCRRSALVSSYVEVEGELEGYVNVGQTVYYGCSTTEGITSNVETKETVITDRYVTIPYRCLDFYRVELIGEGESFGESGEDWGYVLSTSVRIPVKELEIPERVEVYQTGTVILEATITPEQATNRGMTYSSSNTNVAVIDENGVITGVGVGSAVITGSSNDNPLLSDKCRVTVKPYVAVTGVEVTPKKMEIDDGTAGRIHGNVIPSDASINDVIWQVDDSEIVTIDSKGYYKAKKPGKAIVTATTKEHGFTGTCEIIVKAVAAHGVTVQGNMSIDIEQTKQLAWHMLPANATNKAVEWTSSHPDIAEVDQLGRVTGKRIGKTQIKVKSKESGYEAECNVFVDSYVKEIILDNHIVEMNTRQNTQLAVTINPQDVSKKSIIWRSEDKDIVVVDQQGNLRAQKEGVGKVIVYDRYTGAYDFCIVEVNLDLVAPTVTKTKKKSSTEIRWKKVKYATNYRIYKYNAKSRRYKPVKWLKRNTRKYKIAKSMARKKYRVKAYYKPKKKYSKFSKTIKG